MSDPAGRLLSLLSLLQTPRDWPGSELAERLGVTGRTVRRDIERLRSLGYPVEAALGNQGGYRPVAKARAAAAAAAGRRGCGCRGRSAACAGQAVAGIDEASLRALTKLSKVLPSRLRHRVQSLSASTTVLPPDQRSQVDADVLTVLAAATANHERLWMRYAARDGHTQQRHIEPVQLVAAGRRWYLLAFDVDRDDWRTFRVDRVADPNPPAGGRCTASHPAAMLSATCPRPVWRWHDLPRRRHTLATRGRGPNPTRRPTRQQQSDRRRSGPLPLGHATRHHRLADAADPAAGLFLRRTRTLGLIDHLRDVAARVIHGVSGDRSP